MTAGTLDISTVTTAKNHWPLIVCRTWSRMRLRFSLGVPFGLEALTVERLGEHDPGDREGLLGDRRHLGERLLGLARCARPDLPHPLLDDDQHIAPEVDFLQCSPHQQETASPG